MQAYHDHLGRFGAIFGEYQPADLVEVQRLHQVSREISSERAGHRHVTPHPMSHTHAPHLPPQVSREIELKRQLLDSQGANLELSLCPLLCAPMTWAASKWSTSKAKAEGMLKYTEWRLEQREGRPALSRSSHPPAPSTGTPTRRSTARSSVSRSSRRTRSTRRGRSRRRRRR